MSKTTQHYFQLDREYADRFDQLSETEKALLGLPYVANDPPLISARLRARRLIHAFNTSAPSAVEPPALAAGERPKGVGGSADDAGGAGGGGVEFDAMGPHRRQLFADLLGIDRAAVNRVEVEPPFWCDYGTNIKLEGSFYSNFNTTILDCAEVRIGTGTGFGPNVHLYAGTHSTAVSEREHGIERALPIRIGRNCWLGGNTVVNGGVTIGDNCTIGAGSVVTKDIPPNSIAVGAPCKVIRTLEPFEMPQGPEGYEKARQGLGKFIK